MNEDSSFSNFMFGLTVGIVGALLLGTEEGRQVSRKILDSLSTQAKDIFEPPQEYLPDQSPRDIANTDYSTQSTPPFFNRPRSNPSYFHDNGRSLEP